MWVGKAIASAFNIDPEDQKDQIKGVIKALLKDGFLKRVAGATMTIRIASTSGSARPPVEQKPVRARLSPRETRFSPRSQAPKTP